MVAIDVDVRDPEPAIGQPARGHHRVVEHPETGCAVRHGVVLVASGEVKRHVCGAVLDGLRRHHRAPGGQCVRLVHAAEYRVVTGSKSVRRFPRQLKPGRERLHGVDIGGGVAELNVFNGGGPVWQDRDVGGLDQAGRHHQVERPLPANREQGVGVAHLVPPDVVGVDERDPRGRLGKRHQGYPILSPATLRDAWAL